MVVFVQKWLYSGKSGSSRAKVVVFVKIFLLSGNVVVFEKSGCFWSKVVAVGQKWL